MVGVLLSCPFRYQKDHFKLEKQYYFQHKPLIVRRSPWSDLRSPRSEFPVDPQEIKRSIALVSQCDDYYFYTTIAPIVREKGDHEQFSYITPEEIAEAVLLIEEAAGDNRQPYKLKTFDPRTADDPRLKGCEALARNDLFKYRTMARKHQFKTELIQCMGIFSAFLEL